MEYFKHESSCVHDKAKIGKDTKIWQFCVVQEDVIIGDKCNVGANVFIENGVRIGNGVKIKNNVSLYTGIVLEDDTFVGPNAVFTNVINPRSFIERKKEFKQTIVKKGASIGANATIVCGHTIGEYALVGAGAIVTKDVSPYALVVGNPGRQVGYVCMCGEKLTLQEREGCCSKCNSKYIMENDILKKVNGRKEIRI